MDNEDLIAFNAIVKCLGNKQPSSFSMTIE
jgi:hypothetical protein